MYKIIIIVGALLASLSNASAQNTRDTKGVVSNALGSLSGTTSVTAQPQFADGKLFGCIMEFNVIAQDFAYKSGEFIKVGGSFGLMSANENVAITLKVILHDIDATDLRSTPSAPNSAYLISGAKSTKQFLAGKQKSDTPGALFSVFKIDGTFDVLIDGLAKEKLTIAFNRKPDGVDLQIPIDLGVESTNDTGVRKRSQVASRDFLSCAQELVGNRTNQ